MDAPLTIVLRGAQLTHKDKACAYDLRFANTHQSLRLLLDSPLNKSSKLRIYVHTVENVLVEVNSLIEISSDPREFSNTMSYLLKRFVVKASDGTVLAKVIKNPVTGHLPPNSTKAALSSKGSRVSKEDLKSSLRRGFVFFVAALPGEEEEDGEFSMKVSDFELSVENSCIKLVSIFEELLEVF